MPRLNMRRVWPAARRPAENVPSRGLTGGHRVAVGAASTPLLADVAAAQSGNADAELQRLLAGNANTRRILLKGGTIL